MSYNSLNTQTTEATEQGDSQLIGSSSGADRVRCLARGHLNSPGFELATYRLQVDTTSATHMTQSSGGPLGGDFEVALSFFET